jgi:hypothetical protein
MGFVKWDSFSWKNVTEFRKLYIQYEMKVIHQCSLLGRPRVEWIVLSRTKSLDFSTLSYNAISRPTRKIIDFVINS